MITALLTVDDGYDTGVRCDRHCILVLIFINSSFFLFFPLDNELNFCLSMGSQHENEDELYINSSENTLNAIRALLDSNCISYRHVHHEKTYTSEESAKARNEPVKIGGKAMLGKGNATFFLLVLSAAKQVDSNKLKKSLGLKRFRFASLDELRSITGLVPGCIPPFGSPIFPYPLYIDNSVLDNEHIAFNAGSLTDSIVMATSDYVKVANGVLMDFTG